jgi:DNA damage-binding protein 1
MVLECSFSDTILALYLKCKGDFILVGDLMRSFKLLVYKAEKSVLEEISVETSLNPVFMTAMEMIDDENYLGADGRHIFVCQKNRFDEDLTYCLLVL